MPLKSQPSVLKADGREAVASTLQPRTYLRLFALIITIDVYQHDDLKDLSGSVNDGDLFHDFVTGVLRVPDSHIYRLSNGDATRANIIQGFKTHLINNVNIQKGDAMVFFYAGHGSRVKAHPSWLVNGGYVETIVPHDEGGIDTNGNHIYGIPDRTFDALMRHLAFKKGDNIVSVKVVWCHPNKS